MLRTKAMLGETYVELTPGDGDAPTWRTATLLAARGGAGDRRRSTRSCATFDEPTRRAFQGWIRELARAIERGRGEDLNDALGNLPGFVASGEDVLEVLDERGAGAARADPQLRPRARRGERARGQLRELIGNANNFFGALASRNESLAEAIFIFPTFLDESKATLARLREFAVDTRPLVRDLQPVADDLHPTLRDVGRLAPDLRALFRDLDPLIDESERNLPSAADFLRGAEPVFESLHAYLPELNPILSFANFQQAQVADFIMNGGGSLSATLPPFPGEGPRHYLRQFGVINARGLGLARTRPAVRARQRLSAAQLPAPRAGARHPRDLRLQAASGGEVSEPKNGEPPCFVAPPSLFDGRLFPRLGRATRRCARRRPARWAPSRPRRRGRGRAYQGWFAGPTVNSLMVVSSGWSIANRHDVGDSVRRDPVRVVHASASARPCPCG